MNKDENDIVGFMDELIDGDESLQKFEKEWGALSSFLVDYEYLRKKQPNSKRYSAGLRYYAKCNFKT